MKQTGDVPPSCAGSEMATVGMRIFLYGGADEGRCYGDLYMLEIERSTWRLVKTSGLTRPTARYGHSLSAYNDYLVLFGGMEPSTDSGSQQTKEPSLPAPPFMNILPNNSNSRRLWCHRGIPTASLYVYNTMTSEWILPTVKGSSPSPRAFHSATIIDTSKSKKLIVWGGATDASLSVGNNDAFILDLDGWVWSKITLQDGDCPSPRYGQKMVYVTSLQSLLLFGGADDDGAMFSANVTPLLHENTTDVISSPPPPQHDSSCDMNQNLLTSPPATSPRNEPQIQNVLTWNKMKCYGTPPLSRSFHSFNVVGYRLFVFSGLTVAAGFSDLYVFDIAKAKWCRPLYDGNLTLAAHGTAVLHDKLLVFGGAKPTRDETIAVSSELTQLKNSSQNVPRLSRRLFFLSVLEIKQYMNSGEYRFKLVAVGDSGVGKSCLLQRFAQDIYNDNNVSTIGIDFRSIVTMVQGKLITMQLWDTAGQERYSGVTGNYYRNANGFIVVYDATRRESFDHVLSWMRQIQDHHEFGPDTVKLLIGNKQDLVDQIVVSDLEGKNLADTIGGIYLGTSARTGAGVDTAFLLAARQLIEIRRQPSTQAKGSNTSVSLEGQSSSSSESILQWASHCCFGGS